MSNGKEKELWKPRPREKYVPGKPFNIMHPPEGTPKEVLEEIWGESSDDSKPEEPKKEN